MPARRSALSVIEVLVACMVMAAIAIPLLELFRGGVDATRATLQEVVGANLAAELAEQVETWPFPAVERLCNGAERTLSSQDGTLVDELALSAGDGLYVHLSPLRQGYQRRLVLRPFGPDVIFADVRVGWTVGDERDREQLMRRCIVRDSLVPR